MKKLNRVAMLLALAFSANVVLADVDLMSKDKVVWLFLSQDR